MNKVALLKKKIGKDDVILLDEKLLPQKVIPNQCPDADFTEGKAYDVIGISWILFSNRERSLGYILVSDKGIMNIYNSTWFTTTINE